MAFDPEVQDPSRLVVLTPDPTTGLWLPAAPTGQHVVDSESHTISVPVTHFSPFVVADIDQYRAQFSTRPVCPENGPDSDEDGIPDCVEEAGVFNALTGEFWVSSPWLADSDGDGLSDADEIVVIETSTEWFDESIAAWLGLAPGAHLYAAISNPSSSNTDGDSDITITVSMDKL